MDVHKDSITIAVLPAGVKVPTRVERLPNDLVKLKRLLERLARDGELRSCYEASGSGYVIQRVMLEWGYHGDVIAPSLIPKRPGVKRKHDKRDATELARLYRAGELTAVRIPTEAEERVRDVVRCRETLQREVVKSRHYILKFLARRGFVYREGANWRSGHLKWLQQLGSETAPLAAADRLVFREYLALLQYKLTRRDELDREIERLAELPTLAPTVGRLQCFRGISLLQPWSSPRRLATGGASVVPGSWPVTWGSSPERIRAATASGAARSPRRGNSHCRHVLVEAAWHYHYRPNLSDAIRKRQVGQPPAVVAHAWKAQQRLHARYLHLAYRKSPQIAVVGVARELVGFLWAVMQDAPVPSESIVMS